VTDAANADEIRRLRERLQASGRRLAREAKGRRLYEQISKILELRPLLAVVGSEILALGDFDAYLFNLTDEAEANLVCEALHLPPHCKSVEATYLGFKFPFHLLDANVEAFKKRRSVYVNAAQVEKYPGTTKDRFQRWNMEQMLVLPIVNGKTAIGTVMAFTSGRPMAVGAEGRLKNLLGPLTQQLCNAYAYERLRRKQVELAAASDSSRALVRFLERLPQLTEADAIQALTSEYLHEQFGIDFVGILLSTGQSIEARHFGVRQPQHQPVAEAMAAFYRDNGYPIDQSGGATSLVLMQNTPLYFPDVRKVMHLPMADRDRHGLELLQAASTFMLLPIRAGREPIGVLWLGSLGDVLELSEAQQALLTVVAGLLGGALEQLELRLQLERQRAQQCALVDELTGLPNAYVLRTELARRTSECQRYAGDELALLVLDLDYFQQFNEMYGRPLGDSLLCEVAMRLRLLLRPMDVLCRGVQSQLAVILPKCGLQGAQQVAQRLCLGIGVQPFECGDSAISLTVSVGCASYRPGESVPELLQRAESALTQAQEQGRNRVTSAQN
jgi:diguanylate cyclase (GGDEF)-like protein